ncbi:MAG: substrate-binding domain-containing protein [Chloroflexota bacterium]|nr:substrate-binding domain-containing protein [Chloroflexota bacterium]
MKTYKTYGWLMSLLVILTLLLAACAGAAPVETEEPEPGAAEEVEAEPAEEVEEEAPAEEAEPAEEPAEAEAEPTEAVEEEPVEEVGAEEETEEEGAEADMEEATGEPLRIGVLSDLTGPLALFGNETWEGLQIGFDYATDETMAVANRPIELIIRDTTGDVEAGTAAARELIEAEGVELLVGNTNSAVALQVQQIADENEILYFAAPAASPDITGANFNEHTFRICRNSAQDALTVAGYALENIGDTYTILAEDYAFGQATAAGFQAAFGEMGAEFTGEPIFAPSDTTDFTPYIQQINEADPDGLILVWASNTSAQILFDQLTSQGITEEIPIITGFSSNDLTQLLDPGNVGSVGLIVYHYTLPDTVANTYLTTQYLARYDGPPDLFSECGFATAQAIVQALEETEGDTTPEALIPALEGLTFEGPKGTYTIRPEDHQALAPMYVVRLVNVDDPEFRFFELVEEVSAEEAAPPCVAETC